AVKLTGSEFVPAGQVTFKGEYTAPVFHGQGQNADKGYQNPRWVDINIEVPDANTIKAGNGDWNNTFGDPWNHVFTRTNEVPQQPREQHPPQGTPPASSGPPKNPPEPPPQAVTPVSEVSGGDWQMGGTYPRTVTVTSNYPAMKDGYHGVGGLQVVGRRITENPRHGTIREHDVAGWTYQSYSGYHGPDRFTVEITVQDSSGRTGAVTFVYNVTVL